ncbi:NADH-cytochrome b5 reductase-like isoform X1 [Leucoraja erinacea]|uniref:NADH-cytochrome b5 reductase-like isoform X1 n=3 Tax=Leucoraja erinaceus TaxID=7782 RepID=UPI002455FA1E|nr:NADH-cytochrome b5 reductase-like isoform X1 [Leucoraja erinacea]
MGMLVMAENDDEWISLQPREPLPSQCCGSGCQPCVFDIYERELGQWKRAKANGDKTLLSKNNESNQNDSQLIVPEKWSAFEIVCVEQQAADAYLYRFQLPSGCRLGLTVGQHIVARGIVSDLEVQRAYTPVSPVDAEGYFEVLIKIYEDGFMSRFVKTWKEGNTVCWRGPFGNCPYKPNQYEQLLLFASGTGIAPMVSLIQYIVANEEDETFITLVGCFRTFQDIYMKPRLQELAAYWNVKTLFVLSQEQDLTHLLWSYREKTYLGRINCDMVKNFVNSCRRKPFIMVCGSITFSKDVLNYLNQLGLPEDDYFVF